VIDISPLKHALATLDRALDALAHAPNDEFIRDASIQRFEYSYELTHKLLRRYLEESEPAVAELSFPQMIRLAFERNLLNTSWDVWKPFREARNQTSHAYDEQKATQVLRIIPQFAVEAAYLCRQIEARRHEQD
jgi:nucleotidyltransferase substrate binding protein (TIGR01987 family)